MKKIAIITLTILLTVLLFVSCEEESVDYLFSAVQKISLNKTEISIEAGKTETLVATVEPDSVRDKTVTWSSSNTEVATVDEKGVVTGVAAGEATITAKAGNKTATCKVSVNVIHVTGVTLDETSITLFEGETQTLVATVTPTDAADKTVTWSSSDESIATVDSNGKVTAVARGDATITVTTKDGGKTATCNVKVINELDLPLTLKATEDGTTISFTIDTYTPPNDVFYSINGGEKNKITDWYAGIEVPANGEISFYRELNADLDQYDYFTINCAEDCYLYGNVMSLINPDSYAETTTVPAYAFHKLFENNGHINNHASLDLVLPATTLAEACYNKMFQGCTALTTAPVLPATTLSTRCYLSMFYGCTSLTTAPELPATTLAEYCYTSMFYGCTALTTAPELPAKTLKDHCYATMFFGCSSLNRITCLATDISANSCKAGWVASVASTGTFTKAASADWTTGISGIPNGWTVKDYETILPLTLEFAGTGTLNIMNPASKDLQYIKNGGSKTSYSGAISVSNGDIIELYSNGTGSTDTDQMKISCDVDCYVYGNVMSLIDPENYATETEVTAYVFRGLFEGNEHVKNHSSQGLVLPATTLAEGCYYAMFAGCAGLTTAPTLPAETLATDCYHYMFRSCSNLNSITCLATDISATNCTKDWMDGVADGGKFYRNDSLLTDIWSGRIPASWSQIPGWL